jgi:hypothetical protein
MTTTLADIFDAEILDVTAATAEIDAWNTLIQVDRTPAARLMGGRLQTNPNTVTASVGLFGTDLTAFLDACTAADDTAVCDVADYAAYTGWGVGVNWAASADATAADIDGVVFATSLWSVEVEWDATTNLIRAGEVASVAADAPTDSADVTEAGAEDPFASWGAVASDVSGPQFAFSFFEDGTDFYFEVGDTETIWSTFGSVTGVAGNEENADFEFVGAATLTAATSVIVAALLF